MKTNKVLSIAAGCTLTAGLLFSFTKEDEKGKMKRYTVFHQKEGVKKQFDTLIPMSSSYTVEEFLKDKGIDATNVKTINLLEMHPPMHALEDEFVWKEEGEMEGEMKRIEIRVEEENGDRKITKIVDGKEVPMTEEELQKMEEHRHHVVRMHHEMKPGMEWSSDEGEQVEIKVQIDEEGNKTVTKMVDGKEVPLTDEEKAKIEQMKKGHRMHFMEEGENHVFDVNDPNAEDVQIKVFVTEDGDVITKKIVDGKEVELTQEEKDKMKAHHRQHRVFIERELDEKGEGEHQDVKMKVEVDEDGNTHVEKWVNGEKVEVTEEELEEIRSHKPGKDGEHVMIRRVEMDREMHEKMREMHNMKRDMHVMQLHSDKDYTVVLVQENVSKTAASRKSTTTKAITEESNAGIRLFPNPSSGVVTIAFDQVDKEKTTVQVMDVAGKVVFKDNLGKFSGNYSKEINLKEFGAGTYVVEINRGAERTTKKVIIQ